MTGGFRGYLAWVFGWLACRPATRIASSDAGEVFVPGVRAGEVRSSGAAAACVFTAGIQTGEVYG